jgi:acyl-CoA synthetase (AMP-forming)/AMP-acid ligase II
MMMCYPSPSLPRFALDSLDYSASFDPSAPFGDNCGSGFSLAFLQYTSGSTGAPKGVMVGHANIVHNVAGCTEETRAGSSYEQYRRTIALSWLPTFHDMGLMGFHIAPLLTGTPVVYMSPLDFLSQPVQWLKVLTRWSHHAEYSHVTTGGPPFALDLVVRKLEAESEEVKAEIDLSGVLSVILGAEPIRASSLLAFAAATERFGFTPNAFMPAYGLAENVLHVCGKKDNTYPPTLVHVEQQALSEGRLVEYDPARPSLVKGPGKWLVSCGELASKDPAYWPGMKQASGVLLVVHPQTMCELEDGQIGELWISGKCVTAGYWNHAAATSASYSCKILHSATEIGAKSMKASFYRTGDLGCFHHNQLFITGRLKEMIIVNGQEGHAEERAHMHAEAHARTHAEEHTRNGSCVHAHTRA